MNLMDNKLYITVTDCKETLSCIIDREILDETFVTPQIREQGGSKNIFEITSVVL